MTPLLSICIPTHNRADTLLHTLNSILHQATDAIEIVISDNHSDDNTRQIVKELQHRHHQIRYFQNSENIGYDRNLLNAVDRATGTFCWLMGSDDQVEPGAVAKILKTISDNPEITGITVNLNGYNKEMSEEIFVTRLPFARDVQFRDWKECFRTLFIYLGFISRQIIKKNYWNEALTTLNLDKICNSYIQLYVLGKAIQLHPNWVYVDHPCVGWRSNNDSFLAEGFYRRFRIELEYLYALNFLCQSESKLRTQISNQLIKSEFKNRIKTSLFHIKDSLTIKQIRKTSIEEFKSYYSFWTHLTPWLFIPRPILFFLRNTHRICKKFL